ncbi:MAG TPA: hypothetical protein VMQ73_21070 [Methylomirabilota bacterium]|nr:hypothetical protein [Methylomirabilota bacterium]
MFSEKDFEDCAAAERLVDAAMSDPNEAASDLMEQAYQLLLPLVERRLPAAQYLYACHFLSRERGSAEEIEPRFIELIHAAARAGHAAAQFRLGQMLDRGGELGHDAQQSAHWFRLSAEQGHVYAQWVNGLNLLCGSGLPRDATLGLQFIERAAAGRFEGALAFLADAYATGKYGYLRDEEKAEALRRRMREPDVIGF